MYKIKYYKPKIKPRKSNTDLSKWVPNVNPLDLIKSGMSATNGVYEFEDGKDTGIRYYDVSNAKDPTLRKEAIDKLKASAKEDKAILEAQIKKEIEKLEEADKRDFEQFKADLKAE